MGKLFSDKNKKTYLVNSLLKTKNKILIKVTHFLNEKKAFKVLFRNKNIRI